MEALPFRPDGLCLYPDIPFAQDCLRDSATTSHCPWKGEARYHSIEVDGETNVDAAWYYPDPKPAAAEIKDRIAFWKGVEVG